MGVHRIAGSRYPPIHVVLLFRIPGNAGACNVKRKRGEAAPAIKVPPLNLEGQVDPADNVVAGAEPQQLETRR